MHFEHTRNRATWKAKRPIKAQGLGPFCNEASLQGPKDIL